MNYSKEDIERFKQSDQTIRDTEMMIISFVNNFVNIIINHIDPHNYQNQKTLIIYEDTEIYPHRMEVFKRLKMTFPTMNLTYKYEKYSSSVNTECMFIKFDWN
jgi:hypothetical protein